MKKDTEVIDSGVYLPEVVDVDYLGNYSLRLYFDDGKEGEVDLSEWVKRDINKTLIDKNEFVQFGLEHGTLVWSNNLDISPEYLYSQIN